MKIIERKFPGVFEIESNVHFDDRGFFLRTFDVQSFDNNNLNSKWLQDNHSYTKEKGIIRGLHFQFPPFTETKLIRVMRGKILDVFVDLRHNSKTFGEWDSIELSDSNKKMIYIPKGFAHGFCTLTNHCDVVYKVDNYYNPAFEGGIYWNDSTLNIKWPVSEAIVSERDEKLGTFASFVKHHKTIEQDKEYKL